MSYRVYLKDSWEPEDNFRDKKVQNEKYMKYLSSKGLKELPEDENSS